MLPEGISPDSPFATYRPHKYYYDNFKILEHPCAQIRALEEIAANSIRSSIVQLKQQFGLNNINHVVVQNDQKQTLPDLAVYSYVGLFTPLLGTTCFDIFKQIYPDKSYPIGYTNIPNYQAAMFSFIPVMVDGNSFFEMAHIVNYSISQDINKMFTYAVFPFVDRTKNYNSIHIGRDTKLEHNIMEVLKQTGTTDIDIDWTQTIDKFRKRISAAQSQEMDMLQDFENETFTQTDTFSFIKAIALMKKQSVSEEFFDIVPEMEVMYYGMPETEYAIRKEKNMALNKQNEIQGIFNLQNEDLSKMM